MLKGPSASRANIQPRLACQYEPIDISLLMLKLTRFICLEARNFLPRLRSWDP